MLFNLGMLFFFKYTNFFISNINSFTGLSIPLMRDLVLPLGISFYTFQTMSYTIDVYRNKVKAEKNIINFGAFVTLFPQLIAGPIVRYTDVNRELRERRVDPDQITEGIDVYKRQSLSCSQRTASLPEELPASDSAASTATPAALSQEKSVWAKSALGYRCRIAVSYTHLDVYKRQSFLPSDTIVIGCGPLRPPDIPEYINSPCTALLNPSTSKHLIP